MAFLPETKNQVSYKPIISLVGVYIKNKKISIDSDFHPSAYCTTIYSS